MKDFWSWFFFKCLFKTHILITVFTIVANVRYFILLYGLLSVKCKNMQDFLCGIFPHDFLKRKFWWSCFHNWSNLWCISKCILNGISSNASLWFKFWSSCFHNCFKSLDDLVGWGWFGLCSQGILLTVCRVYVTNRWCWINKQTISWSINKPLPKSQSIAGFGRC